MLKGDLYNIQKIKNQNNVIEAGIILNVNHEIFKGHFPGQPVLPGACMMQMTKEILEVIIEKKLQLVKADEIKFLKMIIPGEELLEFSVQHNMEENDFIKIVLKIIVNDVVCCKMKATFKIY